MSTLQATGHADLVAITQNELGENKFTDVISDYQKTVALKRLMRRKKMTFDSGPEVEFNLMTDHNNSARHVGLAYTAVRNDPSLMTKGKMPWRHITWNWIVERRMIAMNRSPRKIVDLVRTRRIAALAAATLEFERRMWRSPASDDETSAHGIPHYVVKSNTAVTTNDGFNGTVPSGYSTVANISPTTYDRWRNYATQYTLVTKDDLIRKMRRAMEKTKFMPLVEDTPTYNLGDDYGIYTTYSVVATMEEILESQNESLGNDLAPMDGRATFRRTPIDWVPELESDTTNPVYGINWGTLGTMGLRGEWMHESFFAQLPTQPTVAATDVDCTYNTLCRDRRRNWVLATTTTMPA